MSEQRNDGGPAFPVSTQGLDPEDRSYGHQDSAQTWQYPGMTLRDYFAAKALHALISRVPYDCPHGINREAQSVAAYQFADAMLKEGTK